RDRNRITHEPDVLLRIVVRREPRARVGPAQRADDVERARNLPDRAGRDVPALERHETAIDRHRPVTGLRRREHPIAGPADLWPQGRAAGVDERFLFVTERAGNTHVAKLPFAAAELRPIGSARQIDRGRREPAADRVDQIFLPDLALELPDAEPD